MGILDKVKAIGHLKGRNATRVVRTQLYGTRPPLVSSASDALCAEPAIGKAIHSVYAGPKKKKRGAPALRRQRSA